MTFDFKQRELLNISFDSITKKEVSNLWLVEFSNQALHF